MRLLFVCTGNLCRSPLAERLAPAWARQSLGASVAGLEVRSAGPRGPVGRPMDPHSAAVLTRLGGDPTGARATAFDPAVAERADLMTGVDLRGLERLSMGGRARELAARLDARRAFRSSTAADDIADPIGQRLAVHQHVGNSIADALLPLAAFLFLGTDVPDLGHHRAA